MRARAKPKSHFVVFFFHEQPYFLEVFLNDPPTLKALHSFVFPSVLIDQTLLSKDINEFEIVSLATSVVVVVVGGSDFDCPGSKFSVHEIIGYYF